MKGMKRMASILLAGLMCITSFDITVFAEEAELIEVTEDNIDEIVCNTATSWAKLMEPSRELEVVDIKEVYNAATGEMEYTASLFDNVTPYGYVVLGVYDNEMVVLEGNVNKGQEGLYTETVEEIVESEGRPRRKIDIEETITKIGPMNYGLGYKDKKGKRAFKDRNGQDIEVEENEIGKIPVTAPYTNAQAIYISEYSYKKNYRLVNKTVLEKYTDRPGLLNQDSVILKTNKYACAVVALMQIAYMEKLTSYDDNVYGREYQQMWDYCKTKSVSKDGATTFGSNIIDDAAKGFLKFARMNGKRGTSEYELISKPSVSWIKSNLKNNLPILMAYSIKTKDGYEGHAVSVLGCKRAENRTSGNRWNFLMVADGWNWKPTYINYSCTNFSYCEMAKFVIR